MKFIIHCITLLFIFLSFNLSAQTEKATISGSISDKKTGEELIGATVYVKELGTGAATNVYGFYSLTIPKGEYTLSFTYLGYTKVEKVVDLQDDLKLNMELEQETSELKEVVVEAESDKKNVESVEMSKMTLSSATIKKIPALLGEVDVIKSLQLLPGVQTAGEGTSGMFVRGGSSDQNLILLDEAPVYNASHLLGFFSVFNQDAIKDVQLYKGGIPPYYGGRLSSVLDIRMKDGNNKEFTGTGGIGTISSRLTLEGPLVKNKSSFIVSGRRTYADLFLLFSNDKEIRNNKLFFYDLNTKINYKYNENNRLFLSGYFGRDVFKFTDQFKMAWGNATATARWNHVFNNKLFSNLTFIYSNFDYSLGVPEGAQAFEWKSNIQDYSTKADFNYYINPKNTLKFGYHFTYHIFNPGIVKGIGDESIFDDEYKLDNNYAIENATYISNEQKITDQLKVLYGLRYTLFSNIGKGTIYTYDDNFEVVDTSIYKSGKIFKTQGGLAPRLNVNYLLNEKSSVKLSYNRTYQFIHLASNTLASSPLDLWFPSSPNVKPEKADQVAAGYFRNFRDNMFEASIEVYYKKMRNQIDFKDRAQLLLNKFLEGELRFGEADAYGAEFLVKKQKGALTGWISYTISRVMRTFPDINDGKSYPAPYDRTHDIAIVLSYDWSKRITVSANWVFITGTAVSMPVGKLTYRNVTVPIYSERNAERLPDYHRLDLALTLRGKEKPGKWLSGEWVFSVYNAYYRKNAFSINFTEDEDNPNHTIAEKLYLFPIIPAVTYNFKF